MKMQFALLLTVLSQVIYTVYSFRDNPSDCRASPSCEKVYNTTVYEKSFRNVLIRKRRGFVFFKGTVAVLTAVTAKAIIATSPRGLVESNEVDIMYDVPLLVDGWRQPFDDFVDKMRAEKKNDEEIEKQDENRQNAGVVNASAVPVEKYSSHKVSYDRYNWNKLRRNYQTNRKSIWNANRRQFEVGYWRPYRNGSSKYQYPNAPRRNYVQSEPRNRYYASNRPYKTQSSPTEYHRNGQHSSRNSARQSTQSNETPSWHHHREYRERRSIYEHLDTFGKALGIKLRKCILRAICEMGQDLLPEGQSFINDVARILFTVPTDHDNTDDEFTQMALEKNVDCARRFLISCPHSPMDYFFTHFAAKDTRPSKEQTPEEFMRNINYY